MTTDVTLLRGTTTRPLTSPNSAFATKKEILKKAIDAATTRTTVPAAPTVYGVSAAPIQNVTVDTTKAMKNFRGTLEQMDMELHSCQDALTDVRAYYKVALKTFIDNVDTQVIERHIIQGLETVFSPMTVAKWSAEEIAQVAEEPVVLARQRGEFGGEEEGYSGRLEGFWGGDAAGLLITIQRRGREEEMMWVWVYVLHARSRVGRSVEGQRTVVRVSRRYVGSSRFRVCDDSLPTYLPTSLCLE